MTEVEKRSVFSEEKNKSYITGLYYDRWTWHKCGYAWVKQVYVPEIRCRCPFQSKTGQVHGSIHQQEENGHNAGDGVEFPWKQHQLERKNKTKEEGRKQMEREKGKMEAISIHSKKKIIPKSDRKVQSTAFMWPFPAPSYISMPKTHL